MTVQSRRLVAVSMVVLALFGAVACSKKKHPAVSATPATFRAGVVKPATLDPAQARTVDELLVADQLFDSLFAYDPGSLEPVPALAASWTASADQQHWDFTLRPDAYFSDGSPVTATDVKATLDRIARKGSASSVADLVEPVSGYPAVAVDGTATELSGVVATSPNVVHIDLDVPMSVLPSVLANPAFGVLPASLATTVAAASDAKFPADPVSSGPFAVRAGGAKDELHLVRTAAGSAKSSSFVFHLYDSKAAAFAAFDRGEVDWAEVPPEQSAAAAKKFGRAGFHPYVAELFYAFNLHSPKFADARFREALVHAVNRDAIARDVYGGSLRPADGLIVDGLAGYSAGACGERCAYSPDRAKALLADFTASGATVPELQLDFEDDKTQSAVAAAIQKDLAAVGVTATLRSKPLADYQQFAVSGQQELFRLGWIAPYPSADGILAPLFLTGSPNNLTRFSAPAVDDQLHAARATADPAMRADHYRQAEQAILAEAAVIPIGQFELQTVTSPRVRGLAMTTFGSFDARTVSVVPAPKR